MGFKGKLLRYVQTAVAPHARYKSLCLVDLNYDSEKSPDYARMILSLQKKYQHTFFVVSLKAETL